MEFPLLGDDTIESYAHETLVDFHSWLGRDISMPFKLKSWLNNILDMVLK